MCVGGGGLLPHRVILLGLRGGKTPALSPEAPQNVPCGAQTMDMWCACAHSKYPPAALGVHRGRSHGPLTFHSARAAS